MLRALLSTRISYLYASLFKGSNGSKKRGIGFKVLIILLVLYIVGAIALSVGGLFYSILDPFHAAGLDWLYFSIIGIMVVVIGVIGSIYSTQTMLFEAKDNDLLLSMPIPPRAIIASRMLVLLLMNYLYEGIIVIPGVVVYAIKFGVTLPGTLIFILIALLLPLITMTICSLFGWVLAWISGKLPFKKLIIMAISLGAIGVYFVFMSKVQVYLLMLISQGETIAEALKKIVFPAYYMGIGIVEHDLVAVLIFALCAILPFAVVYLILSIFFIKIVTANRGEAKIKYKEKTLRVSSMKIAFMKKEISHFLSSPMYMLNAGMGLVLMIIVSGLLIYDADELNKMLYMIPNLEVMLEPMMVIVICYCTTMNFISAPSVSLEGKNLWISKSLPVDGGDILISKAMAHIVICTPVIVVAATLINFTIRPDVFYIILMYLAPIIVTIFIALLGVVINIHFPKFDWVNETIAVKQSASSMISMFGSMAVMLVLTILYIWKLMKFVSLGLYIVLALLVLIGLSIGCYHYLKTKGKALFEQL